MKDIKYNTSNKYIVPIRNIPLSILRRNEDFRKWNRNILGLFLSGSIHFGLKNVQRNSKNKIFILGWGLKKSGQIAIHLAQKYNVDFCLLEDGFIGYVGHPSKNNIRLSLVIDKMGIYYNAGKESYLESLITDISWFSDTCLGRINNLIQLIVEHKVTKYNIIYDKLEDAQFSVEVRYVLLIDQILGDQSISSGLANDQSFKLMIESARQENPNATLVIKAHPDIKLWQEKGYVSKYINEDDIIIRELVNPFCLFKHVDKVYTVTSQMGFEALLAGKKVICFGAPFYAGWGLTDDRIAIPRRGKNRTVEQIFAASYVRYCQYIHPDSKLKCELEDVLEYIISSRN